LGEVLGLAWDCGAVTTGPVTVPVVIALGVGVANANGNDGALSGFGVVTLASLFPVVTVLGLVIYLHATVSAEQLNLLCRGDLPKIKPEFPEDPIWYMRTPILEIILATRALMPVTLFLFFLLRFSGQKSPEVVVTPSSRSRSADSPQQNTSQEHIVDVNVGIFASWSGLLFNIGLTYGLTALGEQEGSALPREYTAIGELPALHTYRLGLCMVLLFAFFLGIGATMAEPALAALGVEVEQLTEGRFSQRTISLGVPVGVASGIVLGILKIIFNIDLLRFLVPFYLLALVFTFISTEEYVAIGWDSAGVTTGPVTVPLVLSIGSSLGLASRTEGFGVLACCSIGPILSVLTCGLVLRATKAPDPKAASDGTDGA